MSDSNQAADRKPFACSLCPKRFTAKKTLKVHLLVIHENAGRFRCSHCDKCFINRSQVEIHERVHTGEKPFRCEICLNSSFVSKSSLNAHHLNSHAEKKFGCETCGLRFGREWALRIHQAVHSQEKPFQCELCPSSFPSSDRLQCHHSRSHGEKKFKCEICGKAFRSRFQMKQHLQCHSSERFQCDRCGDSFQHKKGLLHHQRHRHSTPQHPETPGRRCLSRNNFQKENGAKALQPNGSRGSNSSYSLRPRGKPVSYRDDQNEVEQPTRESDESGKRRSSGNPESSGHLRENAAGPAEPDSTSADVVLDEEQNDRIENGGDMSATASGDSVQDITPIINLISDDEDGDEDDGEEDEEEESDQDVELAAETSIFSNVSLKLVYDVQYRAPE